MRIKNVGHVPYKIWVILARWIFEIKTQYATSGPSAATYNLIGIQRVTGYVRKVLLQIEEDLGWKVTGLKLGVCKDSLL